MLWRALRHVEHGFYIDIGAAWPEQDSVTEAFYQRGWRGLNIEPNPEFHDLLVKARPRDINLPVWIGNRTGSMTFHVFTDTGLSTHDAEIARQHTERGFDSALIKVKSQRLSKIWDKHVPAGQPVHFCKVDVEGAEQSVLNSLDWSRQRPWILLVEATLPMTQTPCHTDWEDIVLGAGYQHVYADGLNRFYVAQEQTELAAAFAYPPNVFDGFVRASEHDQQQQLVQMQQVLQSLDRQIMEIEKTVSGTARQLKRIRASGNEVSDVAKSGKVQKTRESL